MGRPSRYPTTSEPNQINRLSLNLGQNIVSSGMSNKRSDSWHCTVIPVQEIFWEKSSSVKSYTKHFLLQSTGKTAAKIKSLQSVEFSGRRWLDEEVNPMRKAAFLTWLSPFYLFPWSNMAACTKSIPQNTSSGNPPIFCCDTRGGST